MTLTDIEAATHSGRFDFHCHSLASDGALTPTEVVARAAAHGVELLALTDHDTLAGQLEARQAAEEAGLTLVPGIEVSVAWDNRELHVVGLGFDPQHPAMTALVSSQQQARTRRAERIGARIDKAAGLANSYDKTVALSSQRAPGRPWFAKLLVAQGRARDEQHAFNRFLKPGQSCFVATPWVTLEEAIKAIRSAGGVAVLAHPTRYNFTRRKLRRCLDQFVAAGGEGLEVLTPGLNAQQQVLLAECLRDYPLHASGGSDFHTPKQTWLELGRLPRVPADMPLVQSLMATRLPDAARMPTILAP
ncbi:MAG: PHP domain-containing protein [Alcanivoracaceae bacterium]